MPDTHEESLSSSGRRWDTGATVTSIQLRRRLRFPRISSCRRTSLQVRTGGVEGRSLVQSSQPVQLLPGPSRPHTTENWHQLSLNVQTNKQMQKFSAFSEFPELGKTVVLGFGNSSVSDHLIPPNPCFFLSRCISQFILQPGVCVDKVPSLSSFEKYFYFY